MRKVVAFVKIFSFVLFTLSMYIIYILGLAVLKLFNSQLEPWKNYCLKIWSKISLACLAVNVQISGTPPQPPFFLVSNHVSYIDILVYYYCLKTTFVSKAEVKVWPLIGWMAQSIGIIFIDRKRKRDIQRVNNEISDKISSQQGLLLFPEGKTSAGDKILPFMPSLLQYPAVENLEVNFAAIRYETSAKDLPARQTVSWWEDISFMNHLIRLASNHSITAYVTFGKNSLKRDNRKVLAEELQKKVGSVFNPM